MRFPMTLRTLPLLAALLCLAGLRVWGAAPMAPGGDARMAQHGKPAALLLACETDPEKLRLPQPGLTLGLAEAETRLPEAARSGYGVLCGAAERWAGRRVWRPVSRGPPGVG